MKSEFRKLALSVLLLQAACANPASKSKDLDSTQKSVLPSPIVLASPVTGTVPAKTKLNWDLFESTVILRTTRNHVRFICSAILLEGNLVLTTAHCVEHSDKNEVLLGKSLTDPALQVLEVDTRSLRIHPSYHSQKSYFQGDLAVLRLVESPKITHWISIPRPSEVKLKARQSLERVGFGQRNAQNLRTWTEVFYEKLDHSALYLADSMSVDGDSGSAIFLRNQDSLQLLGLHSTLLDPGKVAAVYLPDYRDWIYKSSNTHRP